MRQNLSNQPQLFDPETGGVSLLTLIGHTAPAPTPPTGAPTARVKQGPDNMRILGWTEVDTCDCCGRTGLVRTLEVSNDGALTHYGSTCAKRYLSRITGRGWSDVHVEYAATPEAMLRARVEWVWTHPSGVIIRHVERRSYKAGASYPADLLEKDQWVIAHHTAILELEWPQTVTPA